MPTFGGFTPFPLRFGGAKSRVQILTNAYNDARGTAYDTSTTSPVWVENNAIARATSDVWDVNELLGNQFQPRRMSSLLSRWEAIYGIVPTPGSSRSTRRAAVQEVFSRVGFVPTYQGVVDRLNALLSPVTFTLVHNAPADAGVIANWPGGYYVTSIGTTPPAVTMAGTVTTDTRVDIRVPTGGTRGTAVFSYALLSPDGVTVYATGTATTAATVALPGTGLTLTFATGTYATDNRYSATAYAYGWSSSVAEVTVLAVQPSTMSDATYYDTISKVNSILDSVLPAWVRFHVVRDGSVTGQFVLDDARNLDNERFG